MSNHQWVPTNQRWTALGRGLVIAMAWLMACGAMGHAQTTTNLYVDASATGSETGESFANAYTSLQDALAEANAGSADTYIINIAEGAYYPDEGQGETDGDRTASFTITRSGIVLKGGYPAGGGIRDPQQYRTVLSGDIEQNDAVDGDNIVQAPGDRTGSNAHHVLEIVPASTNGAPIEVRGLTITGGHANGSGEAANGGGIYTRPSVAAGASVFVGVFNVQMIGNEAKGAGGGMYVRPNSGSANVTAHRVVFASNAGNTGGGFYAANGGGDTEAKLVNTVLHANSATDGGALWAGDGGTLKLIHVGAAQNNASGSANALYAGANADVRVQNSWFASSAAGADVVTNAPTTARMAHTLLDEPFPAGFTNDGGMLTQQSADVSNITTPRGPDGQWLTFDDGLRLRRASAMLDAGATSDLVGFDNDFSIIADALDLDGDGITNEFWAQDIRSTPRNQEAAPDLGPYEGALDFPKLFYVDDSATGAGDGTSWSDAFTNLQDALAQATSNDSIVVAAGTYYPDEGTAQSPDDRLASFNLTPGVTVYGGFAGTETFSAATWGQTLRNRDLQANATILSGEIQQDGDATNNSYHVVTARQTFSPITDLGTGLDGVTIANGYANDGTDIDEDGYPENVGGGLLLLGGTDAGVSPAFARVIIRDNYASANGGGAFFATGGEPAFTNVTWRQNEAGQGGGALYLDADGPTAPRLVNNVFAGNTAARGGALGVQSGSYIFSSFGPKPRLLNSTVVGNTATSGSVSGAAIDNRGDYTLQIENTIFRSNTAANGTPVYNSSSQPLEVSQVLLANGAADISGGGGVVDGGGSEGVGAQSPPILTGNPLFRDANGADDTFGTPDDSLHVNWASPVINAGAFVPSDVSDVDYDGDTFERLPIDAAGQPRLSGMRVDIGAFEGGTAPTSATLYVSAATADDAGGGSWSDPYRTLQAALSAARNRSSTGNPVGAIYVAEGTYYPDDGPGLVADSQALSFQLVDNVKVYGGFQPGGTLASRNPDPATNNTVLSGDLGAQPDTTDNSYHVVTAVSFAGDFPLSAQTLLDGFTITAGNAHATAESPQPGPPSVVPGIFGGGLAVAASNTGRVSAVFRNLRVIKNFAEGGAGIVAATFGPTAEVNAQFVNVEVSQNVASGTSAPISNTAGGILIAGDGFTRPFISNARVWGNEAHQGAAIAALAIAEGARLAPAIANTVLTGNRAMADSAAVVVRNRGVTGTLDGYVRPAFTNVTVAGNEGLSGAALGSVVQADGVDASAFEVRIGNAILWDNNAAAPAEQKAGTVRIDSSLVAGGWSGVGSGVQAKDPQFVDGNGADNQWGTADDDVRVLGASAALNAGGASLLPLDVADLDGDGQTTEPLPQDIRDQARVQAGAVDAGAYEGAASPSVALDAPTSVTGTGATLNGAVVPYASNVSATFAYGPATGGSTQTVTAAQSPLAGTDSVAVSADVTGLTPSTTYEVTLTADDGARATTSTALTFDTPNIPPTVADDNATTPEETPIAIDVLANDSEAGSGLAGIIDTSTVAVQSGPSNGTTTVDSQTGTVTYTPASEFSGTDTFTYTVADKSGAVSGEATVTVTVTGTNDAPTISAIPDKTIPEDGTTGPIAFTIGDAETPAGDLTVTATSEDTNLAPPSSITFGGSGTDRTITVTPAPDEFGSTQITVEVSDGSKTASSTMQLEVTSVPDAATITDPPVVSNVERTGAQFSASVNPNEETTTITFVVDGGGTTTEIPADQSPISGTAPVDVSATAANLVPGVAYEVRVRADNAAGSVSSAPTAFTTPNPILAVSPDSVGLGAFIVDAQAPVSTITIANSGTGTLSIDDVQLTGSAFAIVEDTGEQTLSANATRDVRLAFEASAPGTYSELLTIATPIDTAQVPLTAQVAGIDVAPTTPLVAGQGGTLAVTVAGGFVPSEQALLYRPVGASAFTRQPLTGAGEGRWTAPLPDSAVTIRGVEAYVVLRTAQDTLAWPRGGVAASRDNPAVLPTQFEAPLQAPGPFRPETYAMVSVPVAPRDSSIQGIFEDDYGTADPETWRVLAWDPEAESYRAYRSIEALPPGRAVWLITKDGRSFDVDAGRSTAGDTSRVTRVLPPGWSQIAVPYPFPVAWADVAGAEALGAPVGYADGQYRYDRAVLQPWNGYFVYNPTQRPVRITLPAKAASPGAPAPANARAKKEQAAYALQVTTQWPARGVSDQPVQLGLMEGAAQSYDAYDRAKAPSIGTPHVRTSIVSGDHALAASYQPPSPAGRVWDLRVSTHSATRLPTTNTVRLQLTPQGNRPDGFKRYVLDLDKRAFIPVDNGSIEITLTPRQTTRRLRVIVGTKAFAQQKSEGIPLRAFKNRLKPNYPNPFEEGTALPFTLKEKRSVRVAIYNILGQRVRWMTLGEKAAGRHVVRWDGRNQHGQLVGSGVYFYRITAGDFVATRKMTLVR
ncbi:Ig-like domain-containing protein [Salisaeta longa]|uniref:Ig-like domain-containing protein n=1 Tax=Salisaeta longa TaxID=503170 RepID=UPI001469EC78|nr:Ig-like domain-containing protein [Salisaeta longa]